MQGPTPLDLLSYQLTINGSPMVENAFQSFVGQSFADCVSNDNGFIIEAIATNADVGNAEPGNYFDVITLTVEPDYLSAITQLNEPSVAIPLRTL